MQTTEKKHITYDTYTQQNQLLVDWVSQEHCWYYQHGWHSSWQITLLYVTAIHDVRVVSNLFLSLCMIVKESGNELFHGSLLACTFYLLTHKAAVTIYLLQPVNY